MNLFEHLADAASWTRPETGILARTGQHLLLTLVSTGVAALIGIPLGVLLGHLGRGRTALSVLGLVSRSLSTLGLVVLLVLLVGTGSVAVGVALVLLALPPTMITTALAVRSVDQAAVRAGRALGLGPAQLAVQVEAPLAAPAIVAGVRGVGLLVLGTVLVAAYAGAGGLGRFVVDGQAEGPGGYPQMFTGVAVVTALALLGYAALGLVARAVAGPAGRASDTGRVHRPAIVPVPTG